MSRKDDWKRISNLAGLDEHGSILPPDPGERISIAPSPWWKTRYSDKPEAERNNITKA